MLNNKGKNINGQISLEFLIVYIMVLTVFVIIFGLIASQRALTINEQQASYLQLIAQNVASRIDQALAAGNGYSVTIPLAGVVNNNPYNLYITSTGTILVNTTSNGQALSTQAFANARSIIINGTLLSFSNNAIKIYKIPLYSGVLTLSNYYGTIYIDKSPPISANVPVYGSTKSIGSGNAAIFNGKNSYINAGQNFAIGNSVTISAWIYSGVLSGIQQSFFSNRQGSPSGYVYLGTLQNKVFIFDNLGTPAAALSNTVLLNNQWIDVVWTSNGAASKFYVNGILEGDVFQTRSASSGKNYFGYDVSTGNYWNGMISNMQIYNTTLSANEIQTLYYKGLSGSPLNTNSLIGWWPLDGNVNDYSIYGNSGIPYNVTYTHVTELNTHINLYNGANASNTIVGYISNNGNLSAHGRSASNITASNGNTSAFINTPVGYGSDNVSVFLLNQNKNLDSNVVIWAPITPNDGNTIYDLSGHHNNGIFNNYSFTNDLGNATNIEVGTFNGINRFINGNLSAIYSKGVTLSAWINDSGMLVNGWQNILQINGTPLTGEVMDIGVDAKTGNAVMRWTNNANTILNQINATPIQKYKTYFITGIWNGINNTLSLYVNGVYKGYVNGNGTADTILNRIDIGGGYSGMFPFNGSISNVQAYNSTLNSYQISTLYNRGPYGGPLSGMKLIGWWPLDGNANDYSGNITMANNNVTFANKMFYGNNVYIPSLNISNNPVYAMNTPITNLGYNYSVDTWFMIRSENGNTSSVNNPCCNLMNPIISLYDGSSNSGIGINQNFNFGSAFAGGTTHAFSWVYDMPLGSGSTVCSTPSDIIYPGVWYDAIVSVHKYSNITIYINGINYTTCKSGDSIPASTSTATLETGIGIMPVASTYYIGNESVADLEILNKTLNQSSAIALYHDGIPAAQHINVPT